MKRSPRNRLVRFGTVAPFAALLMFPVFLFMLALSVDMGNYTFTKSQLQRAADAGALAGAAEIVKHTTAADANTYATAEAQRIVKQLAAGNVSNLALPTADVQVGYTVQNADGTPGAFYAYPTIVSGVNNGQVPFPNSVQVTVRRESGTNGAQPTYFASFFGFGSWSVEAKATAATIIASSFNPSAQGGLLLPFAVPLNTYVNPGNGNTSGIQVGWQDLMKMWNGGSGTTVSGTDPNGNNYKLYYGSSGSAPSGATLISDQYSVGSTLNPPANSSTPFGYYTVTPGSGDGIPEMTFYGNGSTGNGNFGLVSLNPNVSASESNVATWVNQGPSAADLASLTFPTGTGTDWWDSGQGFKSSTSNAVNNIIGEARLVPIYTVTNGASGNNLTYNIVGFAAVVILNWSGSGNSASATFQPTTLVDPSLAGTQYGNGQPPTSGSFNSAYAAPKLIQ